MEVNKFRLGSRIQVKEQPTPQKKGVENKRMAYQMPAGLQ